MMVKLAIILSVTLSMLCCSRKADSDGVKTEDEIRVWFDEIRQTAYYPPVKLVSCTACKNRMSRHEILLESIRASKTAIIEELRGPMFFNDACVYADASGWCLYWHIKGEKVFRFFIPR